MLNYQNKGADASSNILINNSGFFTSTFCPDFEVTKLIGHNTVLKDSICKLFLCFLSDKPGNNVAIWRNNICVVVLNSIRDFKPKFFVKLDSIVIVCLHVQVDLTDVLFGAKINDMI